jgi:centrosomal protein CEP95
MVQRRESLLLLIGFYLHVNASGENLVRGDKESIKNLLEIFDGLLEYLNEEISEELHNGGRERS